MKKIKVSTIIPAFNAEETISKAIDSLIAQTLKDIEVIIVDDGSTDNTAAIVQEYVSRFPETVKYLYQENQGVSIARNTGIANACGEFIGFCDADDFLEHNKYELMYRYAVEKNADLIQCWHYDIRKDETIVAKPKNDCNGESIFIEPEILERQTLYVWDKIFRKSVIDKNNIMFREYRYAEDCLFLFEYEMYANGIYTIERPLHSYYVQREGAATGSLNERMLDIPKALARVNEIAMNRGVFPLFSGSLYRLEAYYYIRRLNAFWGDPNKKLEEELSKAFFDLFDIYFVGWREKLPRLGTKYKFERKFNKYRSDWNTLIKYIYYPNIIKRPVRKLHTVLNGTSAFAEKLWYFASGKIIAINQRLIVMKYAEYRKQPIKENEVLLTSFYGSSFGDSIYYLALDFVKQGNWKVYVGTNKVSRELSVIKFNNIGVNLVDINSDEYLKVLATAKILVSNSRFPGFFHKRQGQIYLNTWHGTPLKKLGKDMNSGLKDVGNNQNQFMMSDYLLYPNQFTCDNIMRSFFLDKLFNGKVILCGYPRNIPFFDKEDGKLLKEKLGLGGKTVYMYMPTWRGTTLQTADVKKYADEVNDILHRIDELLNDDVVLFVKLHQVVKNKVKLDSFSHIRPSHPLYENYRFLNMTDGLITDYSSVFFDYANTGKDIVLFTYDYDEYISSRGLYFDMGRLPFRRIDAAEELAEYLNNVSRKDASTEETYSALPETCEEDLKDIQVPQVENSTSEFASDRMTMQEFLDEFCSFDSPDNASITREILCGEKNIHSKAKVIIFSNKNPVDLVFMPVINNDGEENKIFDLFDRYGSKVIYVFSQWQINDATSKILAKTASRDVQYVVAPGEMPATFTEFVALVIFRKTGLFKNSARKVYLRELDRLLPNIKVKKIINHSHDQKMTDIYNALK